MFNWITKISLTTNIFFFFMKNISFFLPNSLNLQIKFFHQISLIGFFRQNHQNDFFVKIVKLSFFVKIIKLSFSAKSTKSCFSAKTAKSYLLVKTIKSSFSTKTSKSIFSTKLLNHVFLPNYKIWVSCESQKSEFFHRNHNISSTKTVKSCFHVKTT